MAERAEYELAIDLDGDGDFNDPAEVLTSNVRSEGGEDGRLLSSVRGAGVTPFSPAEAGSLDLMLDNESGDYSPGGDLRAGRAVRLRATYDGDTYDLWRGVATTPRQMPGRMQRRVNVESRGTLSRLADRTVSTPLFVSIRTDEAIDLVLDAAGWPSGSEYRKLDAGKTILDWYWADGVGALDELFALVRTEGPGARLYEDGTGAIVFKHRTARAEETRSNTAQAAFSDVADPMLSDPFVYDPGIDDVINEATITVVRRSAQPLGPVWSLGESAVLASDQPLTFVARFPNDDPVTGAVVPVEGVDFEVEAGSIVSVSLGRESGGSVPIILRAGPGGATVSGLQLRAELVTITHRTAVTNQIEATDSLDRYGRIPWDESRQRIRREIGIGAAQAMADAIVGWHADGRPTVQFGLRGNRSPAAMTQALSREISDRVTVGDALAGVNADFYIERVEHHVDAPSSHTTVITGTEALSREYGLWDIGRWDEAIWAW